MITYIKKKFFFSSDDQVLIVTKTMYYLEKRQMSHLLNATIIPALSYIFYVRHDEVVHLHLFEFFFFNT